MDDEELELKIFFDTIVENVKRERKARKVSQLTLAINILGHSSTAYIGKIELRREGANYNLQHLHKIAKEFDISIHQLIP
ncbi:MAG: transcriptional regulator [Campylobacterota bacterium]|nr:transcriptional regulator [Campylobacterota bacterium]